MADYSDRSREKRDLRVPLTEGQQERKMRSAFNRGYRAACLGLPREPPYAGVLMKRLWLDGFDHALARQKQFMVVTEAIDDAKRE